MNNIIVFDSHDIRENLLPITFTRPISYIRIGIDTIYDKWKSFFPDDIFSSLTVRYLTPKFPTTLSPHSIFIAGHVIPDANLVSQIGSLTDGDALMIGDELIAFRGSLEDFNNKNITNTIPISNEPLAIRWLYDIFARNDSVLKSDFKRITAGRTSEWLSPTNTVIGEPLDEDGTPKIFIEKGAYVEGVILNVKNGPLYIGKDAEIMEGSSIRAPFAACTHATVNMGTRIYGATTLGPYSMVGGELTNVWIIGYRNKAHDGFLGNAVIG